MNCISILSFWIISRIWVTISVAEIEDTVTHFNATVRLVHKEEYVEGQMMVDGVWTIVCNKNMDNVSCLLCEQAKKSLIDITHTVNVTEYSYLEYKRNAWTPNRTKKCLNGIGRFRCSTDSEPGPSDSNSFKSNQYIYSGYTRNNCTIGVERWITYEHSFFLQTLQNNTMYWTSSYLTNKTCDQEEDKYCLENSTSTNSLNECINFCLTATATYRPLALVGIDTQIGACQCSLDNISQYPCGNRPNCSLNTYGVTTSNRTKESNGTMVLCISVKQLDDRKQFLALKCDTYLRQLCGQTLCYPHSKCKNSYQCTDTDYYRNSTCDCRGELCENRTDAESTPYLNVVPALQKSFVIMYIIIGVAGLIAIGLLIVCFLVLSGRLGMSKGEAQRPNSIFNRTYGHPVHRTSVGPAQDEECYDLIDEAIVGKRTLPDLPTQGVCELGEYSSPTDAVNPRWKHDSELSDYATTYDDPIRKQSNHADAIQLNVDCLKESDVKKGVNRLDFELKPIKRESDVSEGSEKDGEGKKNQFKGCLCSMNVSAESDIGPFDQELDIPIDRKDGKNPLKSSTAHLPTTGYLKEKSCTAAESEPRNYHTLEPEARVESETSGENSQKDASSDYEDTTAVSEQRIGNVVKINLDTKHNTICLRRQKSTGSEYEDAVVGSETGRKHVTLPSRHTFCLHGMPEELIAKLGIRIVPSQYTYETYSLLPKSRDNSMNAGITFVHSNAVTNDFKEDEDGKSKDNVSYRLGTAQDCEDSSNGYDRLGETRIVQQINRNDYDHLDIVRPNRNVLKRFNTL